MANGASLEDCHSNLFSLVSAWRGRGASPARPHPARPRRTTRCSAGDDAPTSRLGCRCQGALYPGRRGAAAPPQAPPPAPLRVCFALRRRGRERVSPPRRGGRGRSRSSARARGEQPPPPLPACPGASRLPNCVCAHVSAPPSRSGKRHFSSKQLRAAITCRVGTLGSGRWTRQLSCWGRSSVPIPQLKGEERGQHLLTFFVS